MNLKDNCWSMKTPRKGKLTVVSNILHCDSKKNWTHAVNVTTSPIYNIY